MDIRAGGVGSLLMLVMCASTSRQGFVPEVEMVQGADTTLQRMLSLRYLGPGKPQVMCTE